MNPKDIQNQLLHQLRQHIAPINLSDELKALFHTTTSGAYRRINGETLFSMTEMTELLLRYPFLSFEKCIRPNQVPFIMPALANQPRNMFEYLDMIEHDLQKVTTFPQAFIAYAAQEVPFFHYLLVPEIAIFKLYMWSRTVWNVAELQHTHFDLEKYQQDEKLQNQIKRIATLYASIAGEEIWNANMLDITLNQMRHCTLSGHFQQGNLTQKMLNLLRGLIQKLHDITVSGQKWSEGVSAKISIWYNELVQNNAFILFQLNEKTRLAYKIFDAPNFIQCTDLDFYNYSKGLFDKLKSFALPLNGGVNERHCELFFHRLHDKLDYFETKLNE